MRHLVAGGAGFLGSHLCDRLIELGDEVICLDNFFTGHRRNVERLIPNHRFELVRWDVCDPFHFEVDRIWSLACPASPIHYQHNAARTIETGILGTLNALKLAQKVGATMLLASTSEVYGDPLEHPQRESYRGNVNHVGPRACYDTAKCASEALCSTWARQYRVAVKIARIFNVYGPRMSPNDGRVVSNFIAQALRGEPLTVHGGGDQTRSFCYVDDMVEGLIRLMASDLTGPVNLGNPEEVTVLELAKKVIALVGCASRVVSLKLPADDPARRRPDVSLAREKLGWVPTVSLDEGLPKTVDFFKSLG